MRRFTDVYGARPAHLVLLLASLALAAYAGSFLLSDPALVTMLIWFLGAAVIHDLVLFPLYSLADRLIGKAPRLVNHIRVPLLGAGLTFVMFLPGIIRQGEATHLAATSLDQQPYLGRWLWLVLGMFVVSALVYGIRLLRATHTGRAKGKRGRQDQDSGSRRL